MSKIFIGIDGQVDFINGTLSNGEAQNNVVLMGYAAKRARDNGFDVMWTMDTHGEDYLDTLEGKMLPIKHCIKGSKGWELHRSLEADADDAVFEKPTFGSLDMLNSMIVDNEIEPIDLIIMCGYCTDICGISNALLLRAGLPNTRIVWLAFASAASAPGHQEAALTTMRACQIEVIENVEDFEALVKA